MIEIVGRVLVLFPVDIMKVLFRICKIIRVNLQFLAISICLSYFRSPSLDPNECCCVRLELEECQIEGPDGHS